MNSREPLVWAWWGWEPLQFYLWSKGKAPGSGGAGPEQLRKWYETLHSEAAVKAAAGCGINCIVTHFVKGFGLEAERQEIGRCAGLVELCHRYRIKVFGYLQYGSIFYESFFKEIPEAAGWIKLDEKGAPLLWCNTPGRYLPCINAPGFMDYLKQCIRKGVLELKLDGLHFDNFYLRPCYCERCNKAYFDYCGEAQPDSDAMEKRPGSPEVRRWVKYRVEQLARRMSELREYAESLNPEILVIWNPSPIRGTLDQRLLRAADFCELGKRAGMLWAESGNCPRMSGNVLINQVNFFKTGEAVGYQIFSTTWKSGVEGNGLVETPEETTLVIAEAAAFGAWPGNNFLMRPQYVHELPDGPLCRAFSSVISFYRENIELFHNSRRHGEVAVYFDREQAESDFPAFYGMFQTVQQILLQNQISYDLVFSGQEEQLAGYAAVITTGTVPQYEGKVLTLAPEELVVAIKGDYSAAVGLPLNSDGIAARIRQMIGNRELEVSAPDSVVIERRKSADGRNILHCINYDYCNPVSELRVKFAAPPDKAYWISPEFEGRIAAAGAEIILPELKTWAMLVWED